MSTIDKILPVPSDEVQAAIAEIHQMVKDDPELDAKSTLEGAIRTAPHELLNNLGSWYLREKARYEGLKAELQPLIDSLKSDLKHQENKLDYIKWALLTNITPEDPAYVSDTVSLFYQTSEAVEIVDESAVPLEFCKYVSTPQKAEIKKALQDGEEIAGCVLKKNFNLQIKPGGVRAAANAKKRNK